MMSYILGLDLGTSSLKCLLVNVAGYVHVVAEREYPILTPRQGWAEQDVRLWWKMTAEAIREALHRGGIDASYVQAIGLSGQMHGTVVLGKGNTPLRPAIIWADQRSSAQCQQINTQIGLERLVQISGSAAFPGFMAATLLWLRKHEPNTWKQIQKVLFPKDYVRYRFTGELATDVTDASGGLLADIRQRAWSEELISKFHIPACILPPVYEPHEVVGTITKEAANETGLCVGTPVVVGASDQACGALGSGVIVPGVVSVTIGTGGQLITTLQMPRVDSQLRIHTFCHAMPDRWYLLGAILAAGLSFRWLRDNILHESGPDAYKRMTAQAAEARAGAKGLLFFPYLVGERTLSSEPQTRGVFFGLTLHHSRSHLIRAVMEGVTFALRSTLDVFRELGVQPQQVIAVGGGSNSALWCQILADVLRVEVTRIEVQEQSALGAAMLAGMGIGLYHDATDASARFVTYGPPLEPLPQNEVVYDELYGLFHSLSLKMRTDFAILNHF